MPLHHTGPVAPRLNRLWIYVTGVTLPTSNQRRKGCVQLRLSNEWTLFHYVPSTFAGLRDELPPALTVSPVAHSACPQLQAIDGRLADPSQYAPQYLLPFGTGHSQPGWAHLSVFFSAMTASFRVHHQAGANGRLKARNPLEGGVQRVLGSLVAAPWSQRPHHGV